MISARTQYVLLDEIGEPARNYHQDNSYDPIVSDDLESLISEAADWANLNTGDFLRALDDKNSKVAGFTIAREQVEVCELASEDIATLQKLKILSKVIMITNRIQYILLDTNGELVREANFGCPLIADTIADLISMAANVHYFSESDVFLEMLKNPSSKYGGYNIVREDVHIVLLTDKDKAIIQPSQ